MSLVKGFFALFLKKSAKLASHSSPRVHASVSSSTPAAQLEVAPLPDSIEWVQLRDGSAGKTYYWFRSTRATVWKAPDGVEVVCTVLGLRRGSSSACHILPSPPPPLSPPPPPLHPAHPPHSTPPHTQTHQHTNTHTNRHKNTHNTAHTPNRDM